MSQLTKKTDELIAATEDVPPEYLHPDAGPVPSWRQMVKDLTKERDELRAKIDWCMSSPMFEVHKRFKEGLEDIASRGCYHCSADARKALEGK